LAEKRYLEFPVVSRTRKQVQDDLFKQVIAGKGPDEDEEDRSPFAINPLADLARLQRGEGIGGPAPGSLAERFGMEPGPMVSGDQRDWDLLTGGMGDLGKAVGKTIPGVGLGALQLAMGPAEFAIQPLDVFGETVVEAAQLQKPTLFTEGYTASLEKFRDRPMWQQLLIGVVTDPFIMFQVAKLGIRLSGVALRTSIRSELKQIASGAYADMPEEVVNDAVELIARQQEEAVAKIGTKNADQVAAQMQADAGRIHDAAAREAESTAQRNAATKRRVAAENRRQRGMTVNQEITRLRDELGERTDSLIRQQQFSDDLADKLRLQGATVEGGDVSLPRNASIHLLNERDEYIGIISDLRFKEQHITGLERQLTDIAPPPTAAPSPGVGRAREYWTDPVDQPGGYLGGLGPERGRRPPPTQLLRQAPHEPSRREAAQLPRDLRGAKPRYRGSTIVFASDVDRALYIIAQPKKSTRDADYLRFVMGTTGLDEAAARKAGRDLKEDLKDIYARTPKGEDMQVPASIHGRGVGDIEDLTARVVGEKTPIDELTESVPGRPVAEPDKPLQFSGVKPTETGTVLSEERKAIREGSEGVTNRLEAAELRHAAAVDAVAAAKALTRVSPKVRAATGAPRKREALSKALAEERAALVARDFARQDAADAASGGPPGSGPPPTALMPDDPGDALESSVAAFRAFLGDPEREDEWLTLLERRGEEYHRRISNFGDMEARFYSMDFNAEESARMARQALAGPHPTIDNTIHASLTTSMRADLFSYVRAVVKRRDLGESVHNNTMDALTNALEGKPIPRTPGRKGGSAFKLLADVFGVEFVDNLDNVVARKGGMEVVVEQVTRGRRAPVLPDDTPLARITQEVVEESPIPPGTSPTIPRDLRNAQEVALDEAIFKELTGEGTPPTGPRGPSTIGAGDLPPEDWNLVRQLRNISETEKQRMLRWAEIARLTGMDLANLIRANVASIDLSYIRQQTFLIPRYNREFVESFGDALRAIWSEDYAKMIDAQIRSDPDQRFYEEGADFLRSLGDAPGIQLAEEYQILSGTRPLQRLARNIPWITISQRAFVTGINSMNWKIYKGHLRMLNRIADQQAKGLIKGKEGWRAQLPGADPIFDREEFRRSAKSFSKFLADMSGRGEVPEQLKGISPALSMGLFSLRNNIGRLIWPRHLVSTNKYTRQAAWSSFMTGIGFYSGVLLAGEKMGAWEIGSLDPRSSDFGVIIIGGRLRIDVWGGYKQFATLYFRLLPAVGGIKSIETGAISDYDLPTAVGRFVRGKASPAVSQILEEWFATDFRGSPVERGDWKRIINNNLQFLVHDVVEAYQAEGVLGIFGGAAAGTAGYSIYSIPPTLNRIAQEEYGSDYDAIPSHTTKGQAARKRVRKLRERGLSEREKLEQEEKDAQKDARDAERKEEKSQKWRDRPGGRGQPSIPGRGSGRPPVGRPPVVRPPVRRPVPTR
jgi:hypothetical protein